MSVVKVMKVHEDAISPTKGSEGAAAFDLYSREDVLIIPGLGEVVPTGVAFDIPVGWCGLLSHRSSMAFKMDCIASFGVIDSDFRGEVKVKMFNLGHDGVRIKVGDRVAQILFTQHLMELEEVSSLSDTERGQNGFGSSGR